MFFSQGHEKHCGFPVESYRVHFLMCTELLKLVDRISSTLPEIEAVRPRCSAGVQSLCLLNCSIEKAKLLLQYCSESSKLYQAVTGDLMVSRFQRLRSLLEQSLGQIQIMCPVMLAVEISQIMDDLRSAKFSLDSSEEEAGKALQGLLLQGASPSDSFETSEVKAIQYAAATLHITSQNAILIEKQSMEKLIDKVGDSEATTKKILKYLLYLLEKYGNLVLGDQSGNTRVQHEGEVASENRRKSSVHSQFVEVKSHRGYGHREAQFDVLSRAVLPEEFRCPISSRLMYDPVVIASGQTFERMWIQRWFDEGNDTCPKTKIKLDHLSLSPNTSLKDLISKWCVRYEVTVTDPTMKPEVLHTWESSSVSSVSTGRSMDYMQLRLDRSNFSSGSLVTSFTSDSPCTKIADGLSLMSMQTIEEHKFQSHATINETDLKSLSNLAELEWESQCEVVEEVKRHLNYSEEDYHSLSSENFVEPLVRFLKDACDRRDIEAQKTGSQLLLAFVSKNRSGISYLREEAYDLLETLLNSEDTEEALVILEVLSGHKYCRAKILASGALTSILKMLDSHSSFQERIIKILSNMSSSSDICPRIVSLECIPKLIPFFGDSTLAGKCAFILKNLCDVEEARVSIAETSGCIASVTALLETGSHEDQENAVTVLLSLCSQRVQYCQWVMEEGVIPALVDISINGNEKGRVGALELLRLLRDIEYAEDRDCSGSDIDASKDTTDLPKEKKSSKTSGFFAKIPMFSKKKK
ncbi:hypothetical protein ACB098_02G182300 [Castanea mollissima]